MSFYLLKSTRDRNYVGDVLLDLDQVESVASKCFTKGDKNHYVVLVTMKSEDSWKASYNTEEEAKNVIKELLYKTPGSLIDEFTFQVEKPEDREEVALRFVKKLMSA